MVWPTCTHSKGEINRAGEILIDPLSTPKDAEWARTVMNKWRSAHHYPMLSAKMALKPRAKSVGAAVIVSHRLKRAESIIAKLENKEKKTDKMKLARMQDVGGCRAIVSNIEQVKQIEKKYRIAELRYKTKTKYTDYIIKPSKSGYRSLHIILEYNGSKKEYAGYLTEIQVRTKIQHAWATAVETVDRFTKYAIKAQRGPAEWADFFRLVGGAFALMEKTPLVENTPQNPAQLSAAIRVLESKLDVIKHMQHWQNAMTFMDTTKLKGAYYFLLTILNTEGGKTSLSITGYPRTGKAEAIAAYDRIEELGAVGMIPVIDSVLVGLDSVSELKKAYPNYYSDTATFVTYLESAMKLS